MITTGIIKKANVTKSGDVGGNLYSVEIGIFNNPAKTCAPLNCTVAIPGGLSDCYLEGDMVYIGFVNNRLGDPVILGRIYKGSEDVGKAYAYLNKLKVEGTTNLSADTTIGEVTYQNLYDIKQAMYMQPNFKTGNIIVGTDNLNLQDSGVQVEGIFNAVQKFINYDYTNLWESSLGSPCEIHTNKASQIGIWIDNNPLYRQTFHIKFNKTSSEEESYGRATIPGQLWTISFAFTNLDLTEEETYDNLWIDNQYSFIKGVKNIFSPYSAIRGSEEFNPYIDLENKKIVARGLIPSKASESTDDRIDTDTIKETTISVLYTTKLESTKST